MSSPASLDIMWKKRDLGPFPLSSTLALPQATSLQPLSGFQIPVHILHRLSHQRLRRP
jgi:hypothetical protein